MPGRLIALAAGTMLLFAGCAGEMKKPLPICPGKGSVTEALSELRSRSQNIVPLKANGQCRLRYRVEGKKKPRKDSLVVKLWVNPPAEIYMQGDAALVPKATTLGSNKSEFWLSLRPKEISTYWWGKWSEQDSSDGFIINPRTLLEALGIAEVDAEAEWSLSNEGPFDVLTKQERGVTAKKIYVYSCEYQVRKIEFFDRNARVVACAELDKYREVSEGFLVPMFIKVTTYEHDNQEDSLSITLDLKSIKPAEITEQRRNVLFNRPPPRGFEHEYRVVDGRWIEQPQ